MNKILKTITLSSLLFTGLVHARGGNLKIDLSLGNFTNLGQCKLSFVNLSNQKNAKLLSLENQLNICQNQSTPRPNDRLKRKIQKLRTENANLNSINISLSNEISVLNNRIIDLENQLNSRPLPMPIPMPIPRNNKSVFIGKIENKDFKFRADDSIELFNKCSKFLSKNAIRRADNISYSVNYNETINLTTGGWWKNTQSCAELVADAVSKDLIAANTSQVMSLQGVIEDKPVNIISYSVSEFMDSCVNFVNVNALTRADNINGLVNGRVTVNKTTGGWWYGANEICMVALKEVRNN